LASAADESKKTLEKGRIKGRGRGRGRKGGEERERGRE